MFDLPLNVKIVKIKDLVAWQQFRFRNQFWEMGVSKNMIWPLYSHNENRIIVNSFIKEQKVAVLKEEVKNN